VLPYMAEPVQRDLDFGTTIRVADIFFLTDTTASMAPTLARVKATVTTADTGIIDRIRATVPDVWFGGGQHDDFPLGGWGAAPDQPFTLAAPMTPRERAGEVQTAFDGMRIHGGSDGPESQTEALFQTMTGAGGEYLIGRSTYSMPRYGGGCLEGTYGAPCFREAALPIIVHFTDICSHNGPPGEAEYFCTPYGGLDPSPATWEQAMESMTSRGAKYVGVNVSGYRCEGVDPLAQPGTPCFFMRETTRATGSVDLAGAELVYDLTAGGASDEAFVDTIVEALETIATRVPFDVDTALRDDPTDPEGVDARRFIRSRMPACRATPATDPCWDAPVGVAHDAAVRGIDDTTFQRVVPGTRVKFRIAFQNDFYRSNTSARVFVAFVDVRADHVTPLDTRQVFIVVPATSAGLPI